MAEDTSFKGEVPSAAEDSEKNFFFANRESRDGMMRMVSNFVSRAEIRLRIHFCSLF